MAISQQRKYETANELVNRIPRPPKPNRYSTRSKAVISGLSAISVGDIEEPLPEGWCRVELASIAHMKSGHTPRKTIKEYWGGKIPWMKVTDAGLHHGRRISETLNYTTELGIENSAAVILPKNTVCLSRDIKVGYVVITDVEMATTQHFINWICTEAIIPEWLQLCLMLEGDRLVNFGSGSVLTTIYFPEALSFYIALPPLAEQRRIVHKMGKLLTDIDDAQEKLNRSKELIKLFRYSIISSKINNNEGLK